MQDTKERFLLKSEKIVDRVNERTKVKLIKVEIDVYNWSSSNKEGVLTSLQLYGKDKLPSSRVSNTKSLA